MAGARPDRGRPDRRAPAQPSASRARRRGRLCRGLRHRASWRWDIATGSLNHPSQRKPCLAGKTRCTRTGLPASFGTVGVLWGAVAGAEKYGQFGEMAGPTGTGCRWRAPASVALGQAEHALGDVAQNQLLADPRDARDQDFAQEALDMELLGVAVAAMGQDGALAGLVGGARAEILGRVRLRAALLAAVVEPGGLERQQVRRLELHPALGQGMLDRLVLADRPAEHDALLGILRGLGEGAAPDADRLGGDQDALGVEPMQQVVEALAFLADAVLERHLQAVDEDLVGVDRLAPHLIDLAHLDLGAVEVGVEQRQSVGRAPAFVLRRGAGDQQ